MPEKITKAKIEKDTSGYWIILYLDTMIDICPCCNLPFKTKEAAEKIARIFCIEV